MSTTTVPHPSHVDILYAIMTAEPIDRADSLPEGIESLLRHNGATAAMMSLWTSRPHAHVMLERAPLAEAVRANLNARSAALTLAASHDGLVVDLSVPRLIEPPDQPLDVRFADQWVLIQYDRVDQGFITTRGLESFGLPELLVRVANRENAAMYGALTSGLTHQLLTGWPAREPVGTFEISLRDIAHGLGDSAAANLNTEPTVEVLVTYSEDTHELRVVAQADPAVLFAV